MHFAERFRAALRLGAAVAIAAGTLSTAGAQTSYLAAGRILNQATFGPTVNDIYLVQSMGVQNYVKYQLSQPAYQMQAPLTDAEYQAGDCMGWECAPKYWWWNDVLWGKDQLRERVAYALSKLFVVSMNDVDARYFPYYLNILNRDAFGNWSTLMQDVAFSPAMGLYLNSANSLYSAGGHADENFGRELMQLFSIGTVALNNDGSVKTDGSGNPISNYTPAIVQNFARAFTGYTLANDDCSAATGPQYPSWAFSWGQACPMTALPQFHDPGQKALLRGAVLPPGQTPAQDWAGALSNIFNDPSLPPFVCQRLIQNLVKSNPSPAYINRVASVFINDGTGTRGNMTAVIYAILMDTEARVDDAGGTPDPNTGLMRDPTLLFTGVFRATQATEGLPYPDTNFYVTGLSLDLQDLDENPFAAGSVFSFYSPSNAVTVNGTTLLAPEFELENALTLYWMTDHMEDLLHNNNHMPAATAAEFNIDLSASSPLGMIYQQYGIDTMLYVLNVVLMHNTMTPQMTAAVKAGLAYETDTDSLLRDAVYLIVTSPQYRIMI